MPKAHKKWLRILFGFTGAALIVGTFMHGRWYLLRPLIVLTVGLPLFFGLNVVRRRQRVHGAMRRLRPQVAQEIGNFLSLIEGLGDALWEHVIENESDVHGDRHVYRFCVEDKNRVKHRLNVQLFLRGREVNRMQLELSTERESEELSALSYPTPDEAAPLESWLLADLLEIRARFGPESMFAYKRRVLDQMIASPTQSRFRVVPRDLEVPGEADDDDPEPSSAA